LPGTGTAPKYTGYGPNRTGTLKYICLGTETENACPLLLS